MMLARYLVLPSVLLELALAAGNSSVPESTSTIQITSFITQTAPNPTSNSASYLNGTGLEYASSCNQVKLDWVENRGQTYVSNTTFTTSTDSLSYTVIRSGWIETSGDTQVYTLCDGWPRMNVSTTFKTLETTPQQTVWSTFATQTEVYRNASAPTCTIAPRECSALNAVYTTSLSSYSDYWSTSGAPFAESPTSPICGSPTLPPLTSTSTTLAPAACMYNHATIQLLYWPVSTVGNHICDNNWTTVEATPTIEGLQNTAVGFNTTFTSPTVYMVLSGAYEVGSNYATGTAINGILPMASDAVSSMCALQGGAMGPPEAMDYADFDAPIPASKYRCQPACWTKPDYPQSWRNTAYNITATENLCSTIYDQVYRPALQVPVEEFNSFYANYTNGVGLDFGGLQCSFSPATDGIFFDPPSALQQAKSVAMPTVPNSPGATTTPKQDPQPTPAAPGPTVPTALPQTTENGGGGARPTQPHDPVPSGGDSGGDPDESSDNSGTQPDPGSNGGGNTEGDNEGDNGGDNGGDSDDGGDNGGGNSNNEGNNADRNPGGSDNTNANADPPSDPAPPQNVGEVIASVIGAGPVPEALEPSQPGSQNSNNPSGSAGSGDPNSDPSVNGGTDDSNGVDGPNSSSGIDANSPANNDDSAGAADNQVQGVLVTDSSGQAITAIRSGSSLILPSATVAVGQQTSLAGLGAISVGSDGVVQNAQTIPFSAVPSSPSDAAGEGVYVVDGQTYTADASSHVVVAPGVTLTAGGSEATVSGTTYSLDSDGEGLVVNGVTATFSKGGSGAGSGTASSSGLPQQTANAAARVYRSGIVLGVVLALMAMVMI